ncbi:hypothetical protein LSAT2_014533 [Lamellibrachia satsuma]|nr:hypothetical protein LSAT2_014533 [Lamellibrachia satsuma]
MRCCHQVTISCTLESRLRFVHNTHLWCRPIPCWYSSGSISGHSQRERCSKHVVPSDPERSTLSHHKYRGSHSSASFWPHHPWKQVNNRSCQPHSGLITSGNK